MGSDTPSNSTRTKNKVKETQQSAKWNTGTTESTTHSQIKGMVSKSFVLKVQLSAPLIKIYGFTVCQEDFK